MVPSLGCYARALGGCSAVMSREHYVSEGVLKLIEHRLGKESQTVDVTNLSDQMPGVKRRRVIGQLIAYILCEKHNGMLSPFDTVGKNMFVAMDGINESGIDSYHPATSAQIDGEKLERWFLKMLFGGLYSGKFRLPRGVVLEGVCPSLDWLDVLFNGKPFPDKCGLYYINSSPGTVMKTVEQIFRIEPLIASDKQTVMGLQVWMFEHLFVLLTEQLNPSVFTMFDNSHYRLSGLGLQGTNSYIQFRWSKGPEITSVVIKSLK